MTDAGHTARAVPPPPAPKPVPEQTSAMLRRFNLFGRLLSWLVFRHVRLRPEAVEQVRRLAEQGTVIYVMRYRSVVDYLLANAVLVREGLPLARFAPGVTTIWARPLTDLVRWVFRRRGRGTSGPTTCRQLATQGEPILLFMRSRSVAGRRKRALEAARLGPQYLRQVTRATQGAGRPVFLVPLALFRGKGFRRKESRWATLLYSVQEAPSEARRVLTYLWNAEELRLTVGREVALARFVEDYRREGEERLVRRLARALQIFLYREERLVSGPALLPRRVVRGLVLRDPELVRLVRRLANEKGIRQRRLRREARTYFNEMAANFHGIYFGVIEAVFRRLWARVFAGLEIFGLDRVSEHVKQHPVVLVPCHRSHFDYLIISYIFHENYLSPPHIAAGINLSFWPLGPLFRGAGAYFIRRTFEDNELYKMVFRKYLAFLIREGYTQEFFIEGGRTRSGKMLTPKLGMLSAIVNAFVQGVRRDLYLVPVSIHYGRIPEEEAYRREVTGEEKEPESLGALLRARAILSRRFGTVYVSFADPISLADVLGDARERYREAQGSKSVEEEKRRLVQRLGFRLLREVNGAAVAGATSISATALLGARQAASRMPEFLAATEALVGLLRAQDVRLTASLERNVASRFREGLLWLESGTLVERLRDGGGAVLHVPVTKRINLDFYKNNTIHFFLLPSLVTRALLAGVAPAALTEHVGWWLDLYRWEFPLPDREDVGEQVELWLGHYRAVGALVGDGLAGDHALVRATAGILENFREAYLVAAQTVAGQPEWPITRAALLQRIQRQFATSLLLGDARKPEGNSVLLFGNALSRLSELGHVRIVERGRARRDPWVTQGPAFDALPELIGRIGG